MASALGGVRASALVSRVREAANMEASQSGSSQFVTDAEILRRIDESAGLLYDRLVTQLGEDYFVKTYVVEARPPVDSLSPSFAVLPTEFYRLLSVHHLLNPAELDSGARPRFVKCLPFQRADHTHLLNALPTNTGPFFYRLNARRQRTTEEDVAETRVFDRLEVWPQVAEDQSFRIEYVPWFATYDAPDETGDGSENPRTDPDPAYPGINGWEQWVVLHVAVYCVAKEQGDTSELRAMLAEQEARITGYRNRRDEGAPERIVLTRKRRKQSWTP